MIIMQVLGAHTSWIPHQKMLAEFWNLWIRTRHHLVTSCQKGEGRKEGDR